MSTERELAEVLAPCKCPMCGAPATVYRRPMFSGDEAMESGVPDDYVDHYRYDGPALLSRADGGEARDAARYRWLRDEQATIIYKRNAGHSWEPLVDTCGTSTRSDSLDVAIDKAMAKERG